MDKESYLVVSPAYPPPFVGGSKVWTYNMVENSGLDFDILTSPLKSGHAEVVTNRHTVYRIKNIWDSNTSNPNAKDLFFSYSTMLIWLIKKSRNVKYKAVIGGAFDFANGLLIILCRLLHIPIICLGNAEEFTLTIHGKGLKNYIKRFWLKLTHKRANGFIVVCDFCKDVLISIGVKPENIYVVPSSINPNKISEKGLDRSSGFNVLSVGRIVERKGFHKLILATEKLIDEFPDIHTNIVGDGPYLETLKSLINEKRLDANVTLHGRLDDDSLANLYNNSNLFVLAHMMLDNGDTEGCPTVFSEASGQGIPVIGGTDAGASTVILEGITGYIVDSRDIDSLATRMKDILNNPEFAKKMGEEGIKKIKRDHTPLVTGKRFSEAIRNIVYTQ